jgi:hypothetical protein
MAPLRFDLVEMLRQCLHSFRTECFPAAVILMKSSIARSLPHPVHVFVSAGRSRADGASGRSSPPGGGGGDGPATAIVVGFAEVMW